MAEEIARLTTVWDANFQKLDEKLNKVIRSHYGAAARIKKDADTFTRQLEQRYGRVGQAMGNVFNDSRLATIQAGAGHLRIFGSALEPLGIAGLAAAAGIAALAVAGQQARAAMNFADEIDDASQKLAIGTDALQEYRFAMTEVGGTAADADTAIKSFNEVLGSAQSGLSPRAMKGFAALGFTKAQLDSFNSGEDALAEVARRIADLSKESEQAAVAEKLGLASMLPLLREGADGMEALRRKAQEMGIVMDAELVAKGAQANQEFETMARVIDVQLKSAFVGLGDEVVGFTNAIADALKGLNSFLERVNEGKAKRAFMFPGLGEAASNRDGLGALGIMGRGFITGDAERRRRSWNAGARPVDPEGIARLMAFPPAADAGGARLARTSSRGGRTRNTDEQRARRAEQFERALERVQAELLRAYQHEFQSIENAAGWKIQELQRAHAQRLAEIVREEEEYIRTNGLRGLSEAEGAQLRAAETEVKNLRERDIDWQERRDLEEYRLQTAQESAQAEVDLLEINAQLAITARERHEAERRLLLATLKMERDAQKAELANDPNIDDVERTRRLNEGDRGRQGRAEVQGRSSGGGRMARGLIDDIRAPADHLADLADAYAEIDRLRQEDVISEQEAAEAKAQINADYQQARLTGEGTMLDAIAGLQNSSIKELAAIGKAAAITQATIDGFLAIQKAWASAPFPANLPAVAITTAMTASNVAAIAGMADGGLVTGSGGPRQDNQLRRLSVGEFVVNADAARRNRGLLEGLNSGSALISGLNGAASAGVGGMRGGPDAPFTYAPVIDARGADKAGIAELRRFMADEARTLEKRVNGIRDKRNAYRLGGRR